MTASICELHSAIGSKPEAHNLNRIGNIPMTFLSQALALSRVSAIAIAATAAISFDYETFQLQPLIVQNDPSLIPSSLSPNWRCTSKVDPLGTCQRKGVGNTRRFQYQPVATRRAARAAGIGIAPLVQWDEMYARQARSTTLA